MPPQATSNARHQAVDLHLIVRSDRLVGQRNHGTRIGSESLRDGGLDQAVDVEGLTDHGAVHGAACHMIPIRSGLIVLHEEEPVVETVLGKPVDIVADSWSHPDP